MYYDEDGDLAHEFYEETIVTKNGRKRAKLKRIHKNLIPQVACAEGRAWGRRLAAPAHGRDHQKPRFAARKACFYCSRSSGAPAVLRTGSLSCHLAVLCHPASSLSTEERCLVRDAIGQSRWILWICAVESLPVAPCPLSTFPLLWELAEQCHIVTELLGAAPEPVMC